jgi:hypothetical protein
MGVTPGKAEIFGKRLDRMVAGRPFRCLQHYIATKVNGTRGVEESLDGIDVADIWILGLELAVHGALVF